MASIYKLRFVEFIVYAYIRKYIVLLLIVLRSNVLYYNIILLKKKKKIIYFLYASLFRRSKTRVTWIIIFYLHIKIIL